MIDKGFRRTNTVFKDRFQKFAGTKSERGHLNKQERDSDDVKQEEGVLTKIIKDKIREDGWVVNTGSKIYNCKFQQAMIQIPECTETKEYLIPKDEVKVEISVDEVSKIYSITKINAEMEAYIDINSNVLTLGTKTDKNGMISLETDKSSLKLDKNGVLLEGDIKISGTIENELLQTMEETLNSQKQEIESLKEEIEQLTEEIKNMKPQIIK